MFVSGAELCSALFRSSCRRVHKPTLGVRNEQMETSITNTSDTPAIGQDIQYVKIGGKKKIAIVHKVAVHGVVSAVTPKGRLVHLKRSHVDSDLWVQANYDDFGIDACELEAISPSMEPVLKPVLGKRIIVDLRTFVGDHDETGKVVILPLTCTFTAVDPSGWATLAFAPFELRSDPNFWMLDEQAEAKGIVRKLYLPDGTRIN